MSSTKRVSGDYNIYADNTIVNGNLTVMGTQSSIESVDTVIKDRVIVLNSGEIGAGVTGDYAGLDVDRGSSPNVGFRWSEPDVAWQVTIDGTTWQDVLTGTSGTVTAAGNTTEVQFNSSGLLGANSNFTYDSTTNTLTVGNIAISNSIITTVPPGGDLFLDPQANGMIEIAGITRIVDQGYDPSPSLGYTFFYSKTPSSSETGLYYVNNNISGELPSDNKAKLYGLIF